MTDGKSQESESSEHFKSALEYVKALREMKEQRKELPKEIERFKNAVVISSTELGMELTGNVDSLAKEAAKVSFDGIDFSMIKIRSKDEKKIYGDETVEYKLRDNTGRIVSITRDERNAKFFPKLRELERAFLESCEENEPTWFTGFVRENGGERVIIRPAFHVLANNIVLVIRLVNEYKRVYNVDISHIKPGWYNCQ